jgi:hypothetical protein
VQPDTTILAFEVQNPDGSWSVSSFNCSASTKVSAGGIPDQVIRQEAQRLAPHPAVRVVTPNTLVNIEIVLWLDAKAEAALTPATLLGHHVTITLGIDQIDWTFGDGITAETRSPERAYDNADPCNTVQCADYWGHTYTTTGTKTIAATITWAGSYRVDNGPAQPITGTITSRATPTTITVREARGVLIADPTPP